MRSVDEMVECGPGLCTLVTVCPTQDAGDCPVTVALLAGTQTTNTIRLESSTSEAITGQQTTL